MRQWEVLAHLCRDILKIKSEILYPFATKQTRFTSCLPHLAIDNSVPNQPTKLSKELYTLGSIIKLLLSGVVTPC